MSGVLGILLVVKWFESLLFRVYLVARHRYGKTGALSLSLLIVVAIVLAVFVYDFINDIKSRNPVFYEKLVKTTKATLKILLAVLLCIWLYAEFFPNPIISKGAIFSIRLVVGVLAAIAVVMIIGSLLRNIYAKLVVRHPRINYVKTVFVFASCFVPVVCALNGRKVMT